jgi:hypothetical protein
MMACHVYHERVLDVDTTFLGWAILALQAEQVWSAWDLATPSMQPACEHLVECLSLPEVRVNGLLVPASIPKEPITTGLARFC